MSRRGLSFGGVLWGALVVFWSGTAWGRCSGTIDERMERARAMERAGQRQRALDCLEQTQRFMARPGSPAAARLASLRAELEARGQPAVDPFASARVALPDCGMALTEVARIVQTDSLPAPLDPEFESCRGELVAVWGRAATEREISDAHAACVRLSAAWPSPICSLLQPAATPEAALPPERAAAPEVPDEAPSSSGSDALVWLGVGLLVGVMGWLVTRSRRGPVPSSPEETESVATVFAQRAGGTRAGAQGSSPAALGHASGTAGPAAEGLERALLRMAEGGEGTALDRTGGPRRLADLLPELERAEALAPEALAAARVAAAGTPLAVPVELAAIRLDLLAGRPLRQLTLSSWSDAELLALVPLIGSRPGSATRVDADIASTLGARGQVMAALRLLALRSGLAVEQLDPQLLRLRAQRPAHLRRGLDPDRGVILWFPPGVSPEDREGGRRRLARSLGVPHTRLLPITAATTTGAVDLPGLCTHLAQHRAEQGEDWSLLDVLPI